MWPMVRLKGPKRAFRGDHMRRALWILAVLFMATIAPSSHADSYTSIFTCTLCTTASPTAPDVSFPAPITLDITWENTLFDFSLPSVESTDVFTWFSLTPSGVSQFATLAFQLVDSSAPDPQTPILAYGPFVFEVDGDGNCLNCSVRDFGELRFVPNDAPTTPEPSSAVLMLSAIGFLLVVMWRRFPKAF